jgi:hypothetical protein
MLSASCRQLQAGSLRSPEQNGRPLLGLKPRTKVREDETSSPALETSALPGKVPPTTPEENKAKTKRRGRSRALRKN